MLRFTFKIAFCLANYLQLHFVWFVVRQRCCRLTCLCIAETFCDHELVFTGDAFNWDGLPSKPSEAFINCSVLNSCSGHFLLPKRRQRWQQERQTTKELVESSAAQDRVQPRCQHAPMEWWIRANVESTEKSCRCEAIHYSGASSSRQQIDQTEMNLFCTHSYRSSKRTTTIAIWKSYSSSWPPIEQAKSAPPMMRRPISICVSQRCSLASINRTTFSISSCSRAGCKNRK